MKEECQKYGPVVSLLVPKENPGRGQVGSFRFRGALGQWGGAPRNVAAGDGVFAMDVFLFFSLFPESSVIRIRVFYRSALIL